MSPLASAALPRRPLRALRLIARVVAGLVAVAWLALLVGWLSLHWLILPHIESWRGEIEARAGRMLGAPVTIGAISVRSGGWMPTVELLDVRVLDAERRAALALPRVTAALSARSLLALDVRFEQIHVEAPSLDVRRDAAGRIRVAGLDFGGGTVATGDDGATAADWFFRQREFVIRSGTLRWIDEARQAPPLALGNVDLVVRNGLRGHEVRLDATPPPGWGERFTLRGVFAQPLLARAGDWRRWSGEAYADLPRADVRELRRHVQLPFELAEGDGALRGWFEIEAGEPRRATVDVALRTVALRLDAAVEPLEFEQIEGRVIAERSAEPGADRSVGSAGGDTVRTRIELQGFGFVTGDGIRWPKGGLAVAWRQRDGEPVSSGEFAADRLDVGVIAGIAGRVPLGKALRDLLADVAPQGVITRLQTRWSGPLDAPERYRLAGRLSGLTLKPRGADRADVIGRPGLANASVEIDATEAGGRATIAVRDGVLEFPGVFAEPTLPLQRLDAKLSWAVTAAKEAGAAPAVRVEVGEAVFANADARGEFAAVWRTGSGAGVGGAGRYPGILELDGRIADADAARAARYLPLGLPDDVRSYIGRAVTQGKMPSATVHVRGDLVDFPFHRPRSGRDGEFRIAAHLEDLTYAWAPGDGASPSPWPPLTGAAGDIVVDRAALEIRNARGRIGPVEWRGIKGGIAALGDDARLEVSGDARGPLADMLRFIDTTPVGGWIGGALSAASGSGPADLKLALSLPLADTDRSRAKGSLVLAGNDLRMTTDTPPLGGARGRVDFTEKGFVVVGASARFLGGEIAFEGGAAPGEAPRFTGQGTATAEALRRAPELGSLARLATALNGQAAYRATLAFAGGRPQIGVTSNLVGLGIDLPVPLAKAAATALPLRLQTGADDGAATETLQVDLGGALQARIVRDAASARVVRGTVRVADDAAGDTVEAPALPAAGVAAVVVLKRLDVAAWEAAAARLLGNGPAASAAQAGAAPATVASLPPAAAAPLVFDAAGGAGYLPSTIALRVGELGSGTRRLSQVTAGVSRAGDVWQANIVADQLDGYVEYRPAGGQGRAAAGRVYARLARLALPRGDADRAPNLLEEPPASVPALDVVVDDFELRGKRLGRLEVEAVNRAGRDWQLSRLALVTPEAQLAASGTWSAATPGGPRRAAMDFTLSLADSGALLERLGMGKTVRGGKGQLAGSVSWPGSPLSPDVSRMSGEVRVAIDSGQFLKASPGAARLLGVLSLQSLTRRLLLDFRDLFDEGFAFDNVTGDLRISDGVAATNNLRMRGAAAVVLMEGEADLARETENLRVVVVPEINAGTASLAYAIINPAVGLGTFLAQYLLRKPLAAASTREFRVTGPWDDPKVERIERSGATLAGPGAAAESASAAAAATPR